MHTFRETIISGLDALVAEGKLPQGCDFSRVVVEFSRETAHGDISTNAPLVLAKASGLSPQQFAALLIGKLKTHPDITTVDIAGAGFINLRLKEAYWQKIVPLILAQGVDFGSSHIGQDEPINVEYVSANPTGPLHAGHGRVAVVADVLANLLNKVGYRVTKEFYINDTGRQADILAKSTYMRYRETLGEKIGPIPENYYPGSYMKIVAQAIISQEGDRFLHQPKSQWMPFFRQFAVNFLMDNIREDLKEIGIIHEVFTSEIALHEAGKVDEAVTLLRDKGYVYEGVLPPPKGKQEETWEATPLMLFRSTLFEDDVDRPLKKVDGTWTYFAGDAAYHLDKFRRGFHKMINVWGADHGSHVKRITSAVQALTEGKGELRVIICQIVNFFDQGVPVKMSKRAGTFVTLKDVVEHVGKDVFRFMILTRKPETHFDFDFAQALEQSKDNPVFYVQYAHARACSVLRMAPDIFPNLDLSPQALQKAPLHLLKDEAELIVLKMMVDWPRQVEQAAQTYDPCRLATFLNEFAQAFHGLWSKGNQNTLLRFLVPHDAPLSYARLALVKSVVFVIAAGLQIFGVTPIKEMR